MSETTIREQEDNIRLVGDAYACTEVTSYKSDKARTTAKLKHVQTIKSGSAPGNVARQDLQTTHVVRKILATTMESMMKRATKKDGLAVSDLRHQRHIERVSVLRLLATRYRRTQAWRPQKARVRWFDGAGIQI